MGLKTSYASERGLPLWFNIYRNSAHCIIFLLPKQNHYCTICNNEMFEYLGWKYKPLTRCTLKFSCSRALKSFRPATYQKNSLLLLNILKHFQESYFEQQVWRSSSVRAYRKSEIL